MKKILIFFLFLNCGPYLISQPLPNTKHVLFLGNSYTAANSLAQMTANFALTAGDTILFDQNTPGGYTLASHCSNSTSQSLIQQGGWDFVVLQEQSQIPSFTNQEVDSMCFPFAKKMDSIIRVYNPCAETVFFMTWGRKNGDATNCAVWPPVCTYEGMDSLLHLRYMQMADSNEAIVSPVGAAWHYVRENYPSIELYNADESHPSLLGSYLAACSFYSVLFRKNPELAFFTNGLDSATADTLRHAAKIVVYDSLAKWFVGSYDPIASFSYNSSVYDVSFINSSINSEVYAWNFGDGTTSTEFSPMHSYLTEGAFDVTLIAGHCGLYDTLTQLVNIIPAVTNEIINTAPLISYSAINNCIVVENYSGEIMIRIFDTVGRLVYSQAARTPVTIDISKVGAGIFIYELCGNDGCYKGKIVR